ncbi:MAG: rhomboid family intramembrane serine protease [Tannerellaceae bacterium]|nr:rhomboid family intramembrane serine protease [Tannerellaceae bacterium]
MTILIILTTVIVSVICFRRPDLLYKLSFNPYRMVRDKEWSRFITHGFVHADMMHLFVNMFTLYSFGRYMEYTFAAWGFPSWQFGEFEGGSWAFTGLYFGGLIASSMHDLFKYKDYAMYNSIGASGAVSAVLFSSFVFNPWGRIYLFALIPVPGIVFGFVYLFYCQYMAKNSRDNINHNAHLWGAVYGLLFPMVLDYRLFFYFISNLLQF